VRDASTGAAGDYEGWDTAYAALRGSTLDQVVEEVSDWLAPS